MMIKYTYLFYENVLRTFNSDLKIQIAQNNIILSIKPVERTSEHSTNRLLVAKN